MKPPLPTAVPPWMRLPAANRRRLAFHGASRVEATHRYVFALRYAPAGCDDEGAPARWAGIGSGGNYALAAARALVDGPLDAEAIVRKSLDIAADICVYTNRNVTIETLKA